MKATIIGIYTAPQNGAPIESQEEIRAVPGQGLEGDRHFKTLTASAQPDPSREITLIEIEALEAIQRDYQVEIQPGESRRNLVTRGMPLNHLVGQEFKAGPVTLRGVRLCEPCNHLALVTGREKILPALVHRGGLRAQILTEGIIQVGDLIITP